MWLSMEELKKLRRHDRVACPEFCAKSVGIAQDSLLADRRLGPSQNKILIFGPSLPFIAWGDEASFRIIEK
jgi:hypothetical protein